MSSALIADMRVVHGLFRSHLDTCGVSTQLHDERDVQRFLFFTKPKANIKLHVKEKDYARAAAMLIGFEKEHPEYARHIFSSPECGSFAVEYPPFTRKFLITPLLIEWMISLGLFAKQCDCRECHHSWAPQRTEGMNKQHLHPSRSVFIPPPD